MNKNPMVVGYQIVYFSLLTALTLWAVIELDSVWKAATFIIAMYVLSNAKALVETAKIKDSVHDLAESSREMMIASQRVIADLQGQLRTR